MANGAVGFAGALQTPEGIVEPRNDQELQQRKNGWRGMFARLQSDPEMRGTLMAIGAAMAGPSGGRNTTQQIFHGLGAGGEYKRGQAANRETGRVTARTERMEDEQIAREEREYLAEQARLGRRDQRDLDKDKQTASYQNRMAGAAETNARRAAAGTKPGAEQQLLTMVAGIMAKPETEQTPEEKAIVQLYKERRELKAKSPDQMKKELLGKGVVEGTIRPNRMAETEADLDRILGINQEPDAAAPDDAMIEQFLKATNRPFAEAKWREMFPGVPLPTR